MKRIITLQIFLLFYQLVISQTLNYSETVKYITSKMKSFNQAAAQYNIEISPYGLISEEFKSFGGRGEMLKSTININDVGKIEMIKSVVQADQFFIALYCKNKNKCAYAGGVNTDGISFIVNASEVNAQRLLKAFFHLQELAKNTKDPFD